MPRYDVLTFDCYGTLVDWEAGISAAFAAAAPAGVEPERSDVLAAYAEIEPEVQREAFRPYREVLARTAVAVARRFEWTLDPADAQFLPESLPTWPLFPDTNPALERMHRRGIELGILSNVDDDLLADTMRQFPVPFDFTITAEQVRQYKPAPAHFAAARARVGNRRWLHVAQSWFHDIRPAGVAGIPAAWVNRNAEPLGSDAQPVTVVADLEAFATWVLR